MIKLFIDKGKHVSTIPESNPKLFKHTSDKLMIVGPNKPSDDTPDERYYASDEVLAQEMAKAGNPRQLNLW